MPLRPSAYGMQEAEACERLDPPMIATCQALVSTVIGLGVEPEDRKRTWMADADELLKRGSVETARAIYKKACEDFPGKKSVWRCAAADTLSCSLSLRAQASAHKFQLNMTAGGFATCAAAPLLFARLSLDMLAGSLTYACVAGGLRSVRRRTGLRRAWMSCWPGPSSSARTPRCCGSCGPRSGGWPATSMQHERSFGRCGPNPLGSPTCSRGLHLNPR